jgi:hypothetical protein
MNNCTLIYKQSYIFCSFMGHYQDFCRPVWEKGKLYSGFKVLFYSYSLYHEFSVKYCYQYETTVQSLIFWFIHGPLPGFLLACMGKS